MSWNQQGNRDSIIRNFMLKWREEREREREREKKKDYIAAGKVVIIHRSEIHYLHIGCKNNRSMNFSKYIIRGDQSQVLKNTKQDASFQWFGIPYLSQNYTWFQIIEIMFMCLGEKNCFCCFAIWDWPSLRQVSGEYGYSFLKREYIIFSDIATAEELYHVL